MVLVSLLWAVLVSSSMTLCPFLLSAPFLSLLCTCRPQTVAVNSNSTGITHWRLQRLLCTEYAGEIRALLRAQTGRIREAPCLYVNVKRQQQPSPPLSFLPSQPCYLCAAPSMATPLVLPLPSALLSREGMVHSAARPKMTGPIYCPGWGAL